MLTTTISTRLFRSFFMKQSSAIILIAVFLLSGSVVTAGVLMDWNEEGNGGTNWVGWTYYPQGNDRRDLPEWENNIRRNYGSWFGPDVHEKNDNHYEQDDPFNNTARIVDGYYKKGFKVFSEVEDDTYHPAFWMWHAYENLESFDSRIANAETDRMTFYLYLNDVETFKKDGEKDSIPSRTFILGTYACWDNGVEDGCRDAEGPGNQHYYHFILVDENFWWKVQVDRFPQWRREGTPLPRVDNPTASEGGPGYFASFSKFYAEIFYDLSRSRGSYYLIDEIEFWNQPNNENELISTVAVGYNPATKKWGISWHDMSFHASNIAMGGETFSTFELRYSSSPINDENYHDADIVHPEFYSGSRYTGGENSLIRRPSPWSTVVWTQFELPIEFLTNNSTVYFAIKDMSSLGENSGTGYPWTRGDGRSVVNSSVKTISYTVKQLNTAPANVKGLRVIP